MNARGALEVVRKIRRMLRGYLDAEHLAMDADAKVGLGDALDEALATLSALVERAGEPVWRPIETAPDRERVLVCGGSVVNVTIAESDPGRYQQGSVTVRQEWYRVTSRGAGRIWPHPTHWQPLPTAPGATT